MTRTITVRDWETRELIGHAANWNRNGCFTNPNETLRRAITTAPRDLLVKEEAKFLRVTGVRLKQQVGNELYIGFDAQDEVEGDEPPDGNSAQPAGKIGGR